MRTHPGGQARLAIDDSRVLVHFEGEIDLAAAPLVRSCTDAALATSAGDPIVIDLTDCTFMDSSGLNALVYATHGASSLGRTLRIAGAHGIVLRVLQLTGLDRTLPLDEGSSA
jgi:anti-anti-sigma factor